MEVTGANVDEVKNAIGLDTRIGNKFLNSGPDLEELFSKRIF